MGDATRSSWEEMSWLLLSSCLPIYPWPTIGAVCAEASGQWKYFVQGSACIHEAGAGQGMGDLRTQRLKPAQTM